MAPDLPISPSPHAPSSSASKFEQCLYFEHRHRGETWEEIDRQIVQCRARYYERLGIARPPALSEILMPCYESAPAPEVAGP